MSFTHKLKRWFSGIGCAFGTALLVASLAFGNIGPPPSYHQGYARSTGESAYPGLWKEFVGAWVTALGITGSTLRDVSGYKVHGTLENMEPGTDWQISAGKQFSGYALDFDGVDERVTVSNSARHTPGSGNWTVVIWHKTSANAVGRGEEMTLLNQTHSINNDLIRYYQSSSSNNMFFFANDGSGNDFVGTSTTINDGEWHQSVIGLDIGNARQILYVDNVIIADEVLAQTAGIGLDSELFIGATTNDATEWDGLIGPVMIWRRYLTHNEVGLLYRYLLAPFILRPQLFVRAPVVVVTPCFRLLMGVGC